VKLDGTTVEVSESAAGNKDSSYALIKEGQQTNVKAKPDALT